MYHRRDKCDFYGILLLIELYSILDTNKNFAVTVINRKFCECAATYGPKKSDFVSCSVEV